MTINKMKAVTIGLVMLFWGYIFYQNERKWFQKDPFEELSSYYANTVGLAPSTPLDGFYQAYAVPRSGTILFVGYDADSPKGVLFIMNGEALGGILPRSHDAYYHLLDAKEAIKAVNWVNRVVNESEQRYRSKTSGVEKNALGVSGYEITHISPAYPDHTHFVTIVKSNNP